MNIQLYTRQNLKIGQTISRDIIPQVFKFILSFLHYENLYSVPTRNYSELLPAQPRLMKKDLSNF